MMTRLLFIAFFLIFTCFSANGQLTEPFVQTNKVQLHSVSITTFAWPKPQNVKYPEMHKQVPIGRFSPTVSFTTKNRKVWYDISLLAYGTESTRRLVDTFTNYPQPNMPLTYTGNLGEVNQNIHFGIAIGRGALTRYELFGFSTIFAAHIFTEMYRNQFFADTRAPISGNFSRNTSYLALGGIGTFGVRLLDKPRITCDLLSQAKAQLSTTQVTYASFPDDTDKSFNLKMAFPFLRFGYQFLRE
jgi:hypothetical protein